MVKVLYDIALSLRISYLLHIRRAAVTCLFDCIETLFQSYHSSQTQRSRQEIAFGTLEYALNVCRMGDESTSGMDDSVFMEWQALISEVAQWCISSAQTEGDAHCRGIMYEIVKISVNFYQTKG